MVGSPFCHELCQLFGSCTRCFTRGVLCAGPLAVVSLLLAAVLALASTFAHRGSPLLDWGSGRAVHVVSFHRAEPRAGGHDAIGR